MTVIIRGIIASSSPAAGPASASVSRSAPPALWAPQRLLGQMGNRLRSRQNPYLAHGEILAALMFGFKLGR
ncbi:hypothetical protein ABIB94_007884 [Bradyrhizobium sp. JR7.2]|uniref:hypothetical protein n=1 Tax=unclassified Bradyrhizobium TaxID=2631580 RepID=UPI00339AC9A9